VRPSDIGHIAYLRGYRGCKVTLNGAVVDYVFTADEEAGEVICADLGPDNQPFIVGDEVAERTLHGVVRIVLP
jgi:hypothetical protein